MSRERRRYRAADPEFGAGRRPLPRPWRPSLQCPVPGCQCREALCLASPVWPPLGAECRSR
eukprot:13036583-Alexandrium_andersonii.AAC.1